MTPFAHPLFTSMTGIGFALAATMRPGMRWRWRWVPPVCGWLMAMVLHGSWNGSSELSPIGFLTMYVSVMVPVFGLVLWLAFWARSNELRTVRRHLPPYAAAGWLPVGEPNALGTMRIRADAKREARRLVGEQAARVVRDYIAFATHLAFLRAAAERGAPEPDFAAREAELLSHLWHRRALAQPALAHAAALDQPAAARPWPPRIPAPRVQGWAPPPQFHSRPQQVPPSGPQLAYQGYPGQPPAQRPDTAPARPPEGPAPADAAPVHPQPQTQPHPQSPAAPYPQQPYGPPQPTRYPPKHL
jgi:hypothetical protein